ncbi:MAG: TldD/PmbA family protein, partial [Candidatus Bathyarchaeia archaeon]
LIRESVERTAERALKLAKAVRADLSEEIGLSEEKFEERNLEVKPLINFADIDLDSKFKVLMELDESLKSEAKKSGAELPGRVLTLTDSIIKKTIINTEGAKIYSTTPKIALNAFLTAYQTQKGSAQRYLSLGETAGWEAMKRWNPNDLLVKEVSALSRVVLESKKPPSGKLDVILGPEVVGIICHESCGHPSEADRILGREAAQAGETYLKSNSVGIRVGSERVTVVDDPTLPSSFGFYLYDDEGVKARRRFLIKDGVINEFLHNRETAYKFGVSSNASSRANAFNREPIIRMANTFLLPGDYSFDELLKDVEDGVYIKTFMEWNIDDLRFNQRYVGLESYRIEGGELREMIRNPVLEVTTTALWSAVDAVGKDLEFQAAYCGKGDPMQGIPVWTGGPSIRLREMVLR